MVSLGKATDLDGSILWVSPLGDLPAYSKNALGPASGQWVNPLGPSLLEKVWLIQEPCKRPICPQTWAIRMCSTYQNKANIFISIWSFSVFWTQVGKEKECCLLFLQNLNRDVKQLAQIMGHFTWGSLANSYFFQLEEPCQGGMGGGGEAAWWARRAKLFSGHISLGNNNGLKSHWVLFYRIYQNHQYAAAPWGSSSGERCIIFETYWTTDLFS